MSSFEIAQPVLFKHCDPAGIVFYPRYFEMINDSVEAFFGEVVQMPFPEMHKDGGVPTAAINIRFMAPSRHGDQLVLRLTPRALGKSSLTLQITALCAGETRFENTQTLVNVGAEGRPKPWPDAAREILTPMLEPAT